MLTFEVPASCMCMRESERVCVHDAVRETEEA